MWSKQREEVLLFTSPVDDSVICLVAEGGTVGVGERGEKVEGRREGGEERGGERGERREEEDCDPDDTFIGGV